MSEDRRRPHLYLWKGPQTLVGNLAWAAIAAIATVWEAIELAHASTLPQQTTKACYCLIFALGVVTFARRATCRIEDSENRKSVEELGERVKHLRDLISVLLSVAFLVLLVLLPFGVSLPDDVQVAIGAIIASAVILSVVYSLTRRRNPRADSKSK